MKLRKRASDDPRQVERETFSYHHQKRTTFHEEAPILVWACFFLNPIESGLAHQQKGDPSLAEADLTIFAFSKLQRREMSTSVSDII
jgi:hypothetical protein